MEDVITLSSESDSDNDDSDVEIVGSYSNISSADPLPLTAVRVDVNAVMNAKVPTVSKHTVLRTERRLSQSPGATCCFCLLSTVNLCF